MKTAIAFAPVVYEHAAALINETPWRVSRDPDLLFQAHAKAFRLYQHAPVVPGMDIYNVEAEAYGAIISEPPGAATPAISSHPCATISELMDIPILDPHKAGRLPMIIETGVRLASALPEADVRIPVSGPFSLACGLLGFDALLCGIMDNPDELKAALCNLAKAQAALARAIVSAGLGVAFFESAATPPLISPATFAETELPALKLAISQICSASGTATPCIIGGDTLPILDSILATGTRYVICPFETDQPAFMRRMTMHQQVMVRINVDPGVFAADDPVVMFQELERAMSLAQMRPNVCVGSGVLPYESKPELVLAARDFFSQQTLRVK